MSATTAVLVILVVALAAAVNTFAGFGFSLVAVPLIAALLGTRNAVALMTILDVPLTAALAWRFRHWIAWHTAGRQIAGAVVGMPIGILILVTVDDRILRLFVAAAVLTTVALLARGLTLRAHGPYVDVGTGVISGALNTSVGTNGPPVVAVYHGRGFDPDTFRATGATVFAASSVIAIPMLTAAGRMNSTVLDAAAFSMGAVGVGWIFGLQLHARADPEHFRKLVLGLLVLAALTAAISALSG